MDGRVLGPYRLGRVLGAGGMGVVHEATDEVRGGRVALKLISPDLAEDPDFRDRFAREARLLGVLDSPNVVRVHDHGELDGRLFLATELVPDGDLAQLLREHGAPAVPIVVDVIAQVARGLHDAHAAGLVHRDVKPANVLLRREGSALRAYLGDFGIAREAGTRTRTGTAGTPAYMAPELHTGAAAGVASDVYSLGCLLWTTLTGRPPYVAATEYQLMSAHLRDPVPQLALAGRAGAELDRLLRTAMAKHPDDRYPSAAAFRDDLLRVACLAEPVTTARGTDGLPRSSRRQGRRQQGIVAAAVVAAIGAGIGVVSWGGPDPRPSSAVASTADRTAAASNLARALEDEGLLTPRQSRCVADRWITAAGLPAMVRAGFFDAELRWVERDRSAMTPRLERGAATAATRCAGR